MRSSTCETGLRFFFYLTLNSTFTKGAYVILSSHRYEIIVNPDMVWKPGELQSVYNELSFYVELASPRTNLLKFCLLIFQ